jgi:hypothetical protein
MADSIVKSERFFSASLQEATEQHVISGSQPEAAAASAG